MEFVISGSSASWSGSLSSDTQLAAAAMLSVSCEQ
jgi:hypothetical protein